MCISTLTGLFVQATVSKWGSEESVEVKEVEVNTMTNDQVWWKEIIFKTLACTYLRGRSHITSAAITRQGMSEC